MLARIVLTDAELEDIRAKLSQGATLTNLAQLRGYANRAPMMRLLRRKVSEAEYRAILATDRERKQAKKLAAIQQQAEHSR